MKIERLVIGSNNPAKISEFSERLGNILEVVSINKLGAFVEPDEDKNTYLENAKKKASHYALVSKNFVLATDGGFEISALDGWPAVKSRRLLPGDKKASDQELIDFVLGKMEGVPAEKRTVKIGGSLAISDPKGKIIFSDSAFLQGFVAEQIGPIIIKGYPFRSIHLIPELNKTYAELSSEEMKKFSTTARILPGLKKFLIEYNQDA